jgi:hypothetical protein
VAKRFRGRRRRAEQHGEILVAAAHEGDAARVVARLVILLVRLVLLFVDDDEAKIPDRAEHCRTRPHHHTMLAALDPLPDVEAIRPGEAAVDDRHFVAQRPPVARRRLRQKPDLRHEHDAPAAGVEHAARCAKIHLGLAASGDAVESESG